MKVSCPCCKEDNRIYYKLHWDNKSYDFTCGKCRYETNIPSYLVTDHQIALNNAFKFDILDDIKEKVDSMTFAEKLARLRELEKYNPKEEEFDDDDGDINE
jgi:hypothetical protein